MIRAWELDADSSVPKIEVNPASSEEGQERGHRVRGGDERHGHRRQRLTFS